MKECYKCHTKKPLTDFYSGRYYTSGYSTRCRQCIREAHHIYRQTPECKILRRLVARKRAINPEHKANRKKYVRDPVKVRAYRKVYKERHKHDKYKSDKVKARYAVNLALYYNLIQKPSTCQKCGISDKLQAHHASYAREDWLKVEWLCVPCHRHLHLAQ